MSTAIGAVIAVSGCSLEPELDDQLNETQTKQRAHRVIPSSTLFGFELRSQPGLPTCSSIQAEQKPTCSEGEIIRLQASEVPSVFEREYLLVKWDAEKRIQSIMATTKRSWAEGTMDQLITKFGKPDLKNPNGPAGYDRWQWTFKDAEVTYLDNGQDVTVTLETAEQAGIDRARIDKEIEEELRQESLKRAL